MRTARVSSRSCVCLLVLSALGGCYDANQVRAFLKEPRSPVAGVEYRVMPPDVIAIRSKQVPELNGVSQQVRPDGRINLPMLGEVFVAGLTPKEIEAALTKAAEQYYERVDATVDVVGYNSQKYYLYGEVAGPGPRPWTGNDTLLDALASSPPTFLAWPQRIIVTRGSNPQRGGYATSRPTNDYVRSGVHPEPQDKPRHAMTINLMAMVRDGDRANNILLMPEDMIYVQPNPFAKLGLALRSILYPVSPVLEAARVPATLQRATNPIGSTGP